MHKQTESNRKIRGTRESLDKDTVGKEFQILGT